jgi:hypothetical protein
MKKGWAGLIFWFRTETDGMFLWKLKSTFQSLKLRACLDYLENQWLLKKNSALWNSSNNWIHTNWNFFYYLANYHTSNNPSVLFNVSVHPHLSYQVDIVYCIA